MTRRFGSDYVLTAFKKAVNILCGLAVSVIVARYLGPELRGSYAYLLSLAAIGVVVLNCGVNLSYQSARRNAGKGINAMFLSYSVTLLLILGAVGIGALFWSGLSAIWALAVFMTGTSLFRMQVGHYALIENLKAASVASIGGHVLELLVVLSFVLVFPASLNVVVAAFLAKEMILAVLFVLVFPIYQVRESLQKSVFRRRKNFRNTLFHAGLMPYLLTVLIVVNYKIDILILQHLEIAPAAIGVFAVGVLVAEYLWVVTDVFKDVQTSRTAKHGAADDVCLSLRAAVFSTLIVYVAFVLVGSPLITFMFGLDFRGSYEIAVFMLSATFFMIFCKIIGTYYISTGDIRTYVWAMFVAVLTNCGLNYLLIPFFGTYGAVAASVVSYGIAGVWLLRDYCVKYRIAIADVLILRRADLDSLFFNR